MKDLNQETGQQKATSKPYPTEKGRNDEFNFHPSDGAAYSTKKETDPKADNPTDDILASAKFKRFQDVIISGTLTGYGDMKGRIIEIEYDPICKEIFYNVRIDGGGICRSQERFLSNY